jgi:hypothetical protein
LARHGRIVDGSGLVAATQSGRVAN